MAAETTAEAPAKPAPPKPGRRSLDEEIEDFCTFDPAGPRPAVDRLEACDRLKKNQRDRQRLRSEANRESLKGWAWVGLVVFFIVAGAIIVWALAKAGVGVFASISAFFGNLANFDLGDMFNGTTPG